MIAGLTFRQQQVVELVACGYTNKRIAADLGISHRRVQSLIATVALQIGSATDTDGRVRIALWWEQRKAG